MVSAQDGEVFNSWLSGLKGMESDVVLGLEPHVTLNEMVLHVSRMKEWVNASQVPILTAAAYLLSQVAEDCAGTVKGNCEGQTKATESSTLPKFVHSSEPAKFPKPRAPQNPTTLADAIPSVKSEQTVSAGINPAETDNTCLSSKVVSESNTPQTRRSATDQTPHTRRSAPEMSHSSTTLEVFEKFAASYGQDKIFMHPSARRQRNHEHGVHGQLKRHRTQSEKDMKNPLHAVPGFMNKIQTGTLSIKRKLKSLKENAMQPHVVIGGAAKDLYEELAYEDFMGNITNFATNYVPFCGRHCMIYPDSTFRVMWDCLAFVLILMAFFTVPFELAFDVEIRGWNRGAQYASVAVDIFFLLDILFSCNTAYYQDGLIVTTRSTVFMHYMRTWFFIDVLSSLPWSVVMKDTPGSQAPKLLRLLRVGKFARLLKVVKVLKLGQISDLISDFLPDRMITMLALFKQLLKMLVFCHILGCFWHGVGYYNEDGSWLDNYEFRDSTVEERYVASVYYALTTATTVGYGDIGPQTMEERICVCVIMVVAVGCFGELMGSITAISVDSQSEMMNVHHRVRAATKFMRKKDVPPELRRRVRRYVKHVCEVEAQASQDGDVLGIISGPLQDEVIATIIKKALQRSVFFKGSSQEELETVCQASVCVRLDPGELVVEQGGFIDGLWILATGKVQLVQGDNNEPLLDCGKSKGGGGGIGSGGATVLKEGCFFGDWTLDSDISPTDQHVACGAQCVTHCDFVHLSRQSYLEIVIPTLPRFQSAKSKTTIVQKHRNIISEIHSGIPCPLCGELGHWAIDCHHHESQRIAREFSKTKVFNSPEMQEKSPPASTGGAETPTL